MPKLLKRRWRSDLGGSGLSRRDRRPCDYEAYLADPLVGRRFTLDGDVAADVADAEAAINRLNAEPRGLVDTEALARILLRAESVASSRIEGLEVGARRLLRAEALRSKHEQSSDVTAMEVLGNLDAMLFAVERTGRGDEITVELLLEIQRRLLAGTRLDPFGGRFREVQNWIGGSDYNPCAATFVPPPHEFVAELMADLCEFCNRDDLPAVAQAAVAHAQFETIHPFVDGNGRAGRALIHLVLRRRGLALRVLPPVSLVLATSAREYIRGLGGFRHVGSPTSSSAVAGVNTWVAAFAAACTRSVLDAQSFESRAASLEAGWRERLGSIRANSATDLLLRRLAGAPVLTVQGAASLIGRTFKPANDAIQRLLEPGILRQITIGRRNRAYEAPEIIDAFTALERQLASPARPADAPRDDGDNVKRMMGGARAHIDLPVLRTRRREILQSAAQHGARNVRVFGSAARGASTASSDVDLLVEMESGRSLLDLVALWQELEDLLGTHVDVLSEGGVSPHLRERIYAEAVPL